MKRNYKNKILAMSVAAAMLLGSSAYAGKIITDASGPDGADNFAEDKQLGFGGWNLDNVNVKIVSVDDYNTPLPDTFFKKDTGDYSPMTYGMSFESDINNTNGDVVAHLHGKDWPVGEPSGIKIIDGLAEKNGKPGNCIINTSYLGEDLNDGESHFLDQPNPLPVICTSPFQTHKRFKVNMLPTTVNDSAGYGHPIDLVFNLVPGDLETLRYQVFQKINNYTDKRLDGYKIEVLKADGITQDDNLTLSIGIEEHRDKDGNLDGTDIWDPEDMANFSHGLWGPIDDHFPTVGFFDEYRAGFFVSGHNTSTLVGGPNPLPSTYDALFGTWLPSKWAPIGIFWDDDKDPLTDAELVAFWGTVPGAPEGTLPAWHKGYADNWAEPTQKELITWTVDPWFEPGIIEDTLNLGLNYIVNVGNNDLIGGKFTIRITPRVAADQTPPSYISKEDNTTYIEPPTSYVASAGVVTISPLPTFTPGTDLYVGVGDDNLNVDPTQAEEVNITVTSTTGDSELITLTETGVDTGIFSATLPSENSGNAPTDNNGIISVIEDSVVTATYVDIHYGNTSTTETLTASTIAKSPVAPTVDSDLNPSSGGGGCTYNPDSKNFDMMFLVMMALGLLYPFRRRFIK